MEISKNYERSIITWNRRNTSNNLEVDTGLGNTNDSDYFFKVDRDFPMARGTKGNPEEPGIYRLITLGNILSNLFSMILCRRLDKWLERGKRLLFLKVVVL